MPVPVSIRDSVVAVVATLFLPLSVLALDYFIRAKIQIDTWNELIARSGPDCCVLSLGTTGAIFVDPHVNSISGIKSPLFIIGLIIFLIFMRVACISKSVPSGKLGTPPSLRYGVCSLLAIFFVMVISYGYDVYNKVPHP
jgi:hypothetical protein